MLIHTYIYIFQPHLLSLFFVNFLSPFLNLLTVITINLKSGQSISIDIYTTFLVANFQSILLEYESPTHKSLILIVHSGQEC